VELAALRGDNSYNLPGVPGVWDKKAAKLLTTFGDLDTGTSGSTRSPAGRSRRCWRSTASRWS